ncbi:MAG: phosphoribosylanthranilate isomerase [Acidobacteriota bacterium]|nr:phosphoribosylanthranilate isomerase [Acidobacteriota bacterium]MDE3043810.1 phosphoribosylanthranilate isomerase [Acidobacteriota bacterium]MDE3106704.1 phosphoribosylanthranilate isomerase [Acidobacteriota bacterium]MDE3223224.1 phosphoribosylanthranilate isomerase [Acidobacteriota bacterium]
MTNLLAHSSLIKICGVTKVDDARAIADAGADALGLIFANSARQVNPVVAAQIIERTRTSLWHVGVFRDRADEEILEVLNHVKVEAVQLHDPLSESLRVELRARGLFIIKALDITSGEFATFDDRLIDVLLIDGPRAGSGETHDWGALRARHFHVPWIAAGGLTSENVAALIQQWHPWGVDTASGVESAPGVKDAARVGNFVANARRAFSQKEKPS